VLKNLNTEWTQVNAMLVNELLQVNRATRLDARGKWEQILTIALKNATDEELPQPRPSSIKPAPRPKNLKDQGESPANQADACKTCQRRHRGECWKCVDCGEFGHKNKNYAKCSERGEANDAARPPKSSEERKKGGQKVINTVADPENPNPRNVKESVSLLCTNGKELTLELDSASPDNLIRTSTLENLGYNDLFTQYPTPQMPYGTAGPGGSVTRQGRAKIPFLLGGQEIKIDFEVSDNLTTDLLNIATLAVDYPNSKHRNPGKVRINGVDFVKDGAIENVFRQPTLTSGVLAIISSHITGDTTGDIRDEDPTEDSKYITDVHVDTEEEIIAKNTKEVDRILKEAPSWISEAQRNRLETIMRDWVIKDAAMVNQTPPDRGENGDQNFDIELKPDVRLKHERRWKTNVKKAADAIIEWEEDLVRRKRARWRYPAWAYKISNIVCPWQKTKYRPCGGYVALNNDTVLHPVSVVSMQEVLASLDPNAKVWFQGDVKQGFYIVKTTERAQKLMALWSYARPGMILVPEVMMFGPKNAPMKFAEIFQNATATADLKSYVDDFVGEGVGETKSESFDDLLDKLETTKDCFLQNFILMAFNKFHLGEKIPLCGGHYSAAGYEVDPERVRALRELPYPKDVKQLKSFSQMIRYVAPHVPELSIAMAPMNRLLKKNVKFVFDDEMQRAWDRVKEMLLDHVAIFPFDPTLDSYICSDASNDGYGYVFFQKTADDSIRIIKCRSKTWPTGRLRAAATIEQEAYAGVFAIRNCEEYLIQTHTTLFVDHKPLIWLLKTLNERSNLWAGNALRSVLYLSTFDIDIRHIAGSDNHLADLLSRMHATTGTVNKLSKKERVDLWKEIKSSDQSIYSVLFELGIGKEDPMFPDDVFGTLVAKIIRKQPIPQDLQLDVWEDLVADARRLAKELRIENGRLVHESGGIYVPKGTERIDLLTKAHGPQVGHFGFEETMRRLKSVWWPYIDLHVAELLSMCPQCAKNMTRKSIPNHLRPNPITLVGTVWEVDLQGPFLELDGYQYLFWAVDQSSKFTIAAPLKRKESIEVARTAYNSIYCKYGVLPYVRTDRGREFDNEIWSQMASVLGLGREYTAPYHKEGLSIIGSIHRLANRLFRSLIGPDQNHWIDVMHKVTFILNARTPSTTLIPPFTAFMGRPVQHAIQFSTDPTKEETRPLGDFLRDALIVRETTANLSGRARGLRVHNGDVVVSGKNAPTKSFTDEEIIDIDGEDYFNITKQRDRTDNDWIGKWVRPIIFGTKKGYSTKWRPKRQGLYEVKRIIHNNTVEIQNVKIRRTFSSATTSF
jgi:hypothetical protein